MRVGKPALIVCVLLALAGCQSSLAGEGTPVLPSVGPSPASPSVGRPTHPAESSAGSGLQFRPVNATASSPCGAGEYADPDGPACYRLGAPILTAGSDVRAAVSMSAQGTWQVTVSLNPADSARLAAYTGRHVGEQLAIVLDGQVLIAPTVQARIGRSIAITGNLTAAQAKELARRIGG